MYRDLTLDGNHAAHCADWEERLRLHCIERRMKLAARIKGSRHAHC